MIKLNYNQLKASDPQNNIWVCANAGSGKTKILVDRILRLILQDVRPSQILALTFTNAAASEMKERIIAKLSAWSIMDYSDLIQELNLLLNKNPTTEEIKLAQTSFFMIVDHIEKFNICTIHSFAQTILKKFPLEAGLAPEFKIIDELEEQNLLQNLKQKILLNSNKDDELLNILHFLANNIKDMHFYSLIEELINQRIKLFSILNRFKLEDIITNYREYLNIDIEDEQEIIKDYLNNLDIIAIPEDIMLDAKITDKKLLEALIIFLQLNNEEKINKFDDYVDIFFVQKGTPRVKLFTQKIREKHLDFVNIIESEQAIMMEVVDKIKSIKIYKLSTSLIKLAKKIYDNYANIKAKNNVIDHNDVILKCLNLLYQQENCQWILYKLDYKFDHLLLDEAQDTSPEQWMIIQKITEDFYAGISRSENNRTIFVVGDEKQSIYSFQGANPIYFSFMNQYFQNMINDAKKSFLNIELSLSYRSTSVILDFVDNIFNQEQYVHKVQFINDKIHHETFRKDDNNLGLIQVWDILELENQENQEENQDQSILPEWKLPVEYQVEEDVNQKFADKLALTIKSWFDHKKILPNKKRLMRANDILILVRRRNDLVTKIVKAFQAQKIPINGEDRLNLNSHFMINDLISIGKFILLPHDDFNLAVILKSPLINFGEDDLMNLAIKREKQSIWEYLQNNSYENKIWQNAHQILNQILQKSDHLIFELFYEILSQNNLLEKYMNIFGEYVKDLMQEFLNIALNYQQTKSTNLQEFIDWFNNTNIEIKREQSQKEDCVRIMTIHGAKGLQAPIVFLVDTTAVPSSSEQIYWAEAENMYIALWAANAQNYNKKILEAKETKKEADFAEYLRLLYVAITRAEDELYVTGIKSNRKIPENCWYNIMKDTIVKDNNTMELIENDHKLWQVKNYDDHLEIQLLDKNYDNNQETILPESLLQDYKNKYNNQFNVISSATKSNIKNFYDNINNKLDFSEGLLTHKLLQYSSCFTEVIKNEISNNFEYCQLEDIQNKVNKTINNHQDIFYENSWAEVPFVYHYNDQIIKGRIDRLVIKNNQIKIIDYKTNKIIPKNLSQIPVKYIEQLKIYKLAVQKIFPEYNINTYILWIEDNKLQLISELETHNN